jgi:hypothetical protein
MRTTCAIEVELAQLRRFRTNMTNARSTWPTSGQSANYGGRPDEHGSSFMALGDGRHNLPMKAELRLLPKCTTRLQAIRSTWRC